jgi:hypothetical protein
MQEAAMSLGEIMPCRIEILSTGELQPLRQAELARMVFRQIWLPNGHSGTFEATIRRQGWPRISQVKTWSYDLSWPVGQDGNAKPAGFPGNS